MSHSGPAWLGIGAQRSGTTWFTDLLTQHPQVGLGTNGKKEQHLLHKVADGRAARRRRTSTCSRHDDVRRGEWTPQYLRHASAPAAAARLVPDAPVLVLLRDPVERFRSAMRLAATRPRPASRPGPTRCRSPCRPSPASTPTSSPRGRATSGRDRMHVVMVYEEVAAPRRPPSTTVWRRLGLDPVALADVESASGSSSRADWDWPEGLKESLEVMYRPRWPASRPTGAWTSPSGPDRVARAVTGLAKRGCPQTGAG